MANAAATAHVQPETPPALTHVYVRGELLHALSVARTGNGQVRVQTEHGWVSMVSGNGTTLLRLCSDQVNPSITCSTRVTWSSDLEPEPEPGLPRGSTAGRATATNELDTVLRLLQDASVCVAEAEKKADQSVALVGEAKARQTGVDTREQSWKAANLAFEDAMAQASATTKPVPSLLAELSSPHRLKSTQVRDKSKPAIDEAASYGLTTRKQGLISELTAPRYLKTTEVSDKSGPNIDVKAVYGVTTRKCGRAILPSRIVTRLILGSGVFSGLGSQSTLRIKL